MKNQIKLDKTSSPIICGNDVLSKLKKDIQSILSKNDTLFVLLDEHSKKYCLPLLLKQLPNISTKNIITIKSGEHHKHLKTCEQVWKQLTNLGADRHSLLINLGGGTISDLGGFVASTYKRGVRYLNIPTTLLAMVDASVGGKVGIDFEGLKNHIGLFSKPSGVFVYPNFIKTLPKKQLLCGYAEMLKHGLIADAKYWKELTAVDISKLDVKKWNELIIRSIEIKEHIVENDPEEKGERKLLNFGHTIAHALEAYTYQYSKKDLLHGEAVAWGMIVEAYISYKKKSLPLASLEEVVKVINKYFLLDIGIKSMDALIKLMLQDKKNRGNKINFTLLSAIGKGTYDNVCEPKIIREALQFTQQQFQ